MSLGKSCVKLWKYMKCQLESKSSTLFRSVLSNCALSMCSVMSDSQKPPGRGEPHTKQITMKVSIDQSALYQQELRNFKFDFQYSYKCILSSFSIFTWHCLSNKHFCSHDLTIISFYHFTSSYFYQSLKSEWEFQKDLIIIVFKFISKKLFWYRITFKYSNMWNI